MLLHGDMRCAGSKLLLSCRPSVWLAKRRDAAPDKPALQARCSGLKAQARLSICGRPGVAGLLCQQGLCRHWVTQPAAMQVCQPSSAVSCAQRQHTGLSVLCVEGGGQGTLVEPQQYRPSTSAARAAYSSGQLFCRKRCSCPHTCTVRTGGPHQQRCSCFSHEPHVNGCSFQSGKGWSSSCAAGWR